MSLAPGSLCGEDLVLEDYAQRASSIPRSDSQSKVLELEPGNDTGVRLWKL